MCRIPSMVETQDSTKTRFSSSFMATMPALTTNLVFMVMLSNSITFVLLNSSSSGLRMLKRASERSLKA